MSMVQLDASYESETSTYRYLIPETEYPHNHPEVIHWVRHFTEAADKRKVFANINAALKHNRTLTTANTMATAWYDFSRYVPVFITKAVTQTSNPEHQHHLIQIAYDELGGRDKKHIHSKLFLDAITDVGIQRAPCPDELSINNTLQTLDRALSKTQSQFGIIGLLLSIEILAEKNIEVLFESLCYENAYRQMLSDSLFFKIHRADEAEHIRHSVANFLRFCKTEIARKEFSQSFNEGIDFWHRFWDQCARLVNLGI